MRLVINQALLDLFRARRIYARPGQRTSWRVGEVLRSDDEVEIEPYVHLLAGGTLPRKLGAFSYAVTSLDQGMTIGRYCSIGPNVSRMGLQHPTEWATTTPHSYEDQLEGMDAYFADRGIERPSLLPFDAGNGDITIGHDVWIGSSALIKRGVTIGTGAVVAARATVTRDVPPYAVVAGTPARILRYRFPDAVIESLLASEWWRYGPDVVLPLDIREPHHLAERLAAAIAAGARPLAPAPLTARDMIHAVEPGAA